MIHIKTLKSLSSIRIENDHLSVEIIPAIGGRITSIYHKTAQHEFLWQNTSVPLRKCHPGDSYDANFYGGIDEILPNDLPGCLLNRKYFDHGELWTTPLQSKIITQSVVVGGDLKCGLRYRRKTRLHPTSPAIINDYLIQNRTNKPVSFIWKMHAALNICPDDTIECPAATARVADPAWSRWRTTTKFPWPAFNQSKANIIPPPDNTTDYLYLERLSQGYVGLYSPSRNIRFTYRFDTKVFSCVCYFASYGGLNGHYVAVLEPSTIPAASIPEAIAQKSNYVLSAGQSIITTVTINVWPHL